MQCIRIIWPLNGSNKQNRSQLEGKVDYVTIWSTEKSIHRDLIINVALAVHFATVQWIDYLYSSRWVPSRPRPHSGEGSKNSDGPPTRRARHRACVCAWALNRRSSSANTYTRSSIYLVEFIIVVQYMGVRRQCCRRSSCIVAQLSCWPPDVCIV